MKRELFNFQFGDELLSTVDRLLIVDRALDLPVPRNRLVDFNALLTHSDVHTEQPRYDEQMTGRFVSTSACFLGQRGYFPGTLPQLNVVSLDHCLAAAMAASSSSLSLSRRQADEGEPVADLRGGFSLASLPHQIVALRTGGQFLGLCLIATSLPGESLFERYSIFASSSSHGRSLHDDDGGS
jgi:hypothetical protein